MLRIGFAMAGVALVASACSSAVSAGASTSSDAIGAYVQFTEDRSEATQLLDPLTKAAPGEASTPAGFIPGLRATFVVRDSEGVFGVQIIFQADVTRDDRQLLEQRARSLGLRLKWLGPADYWPDCEGEPDCFLVGDTPSLP